MAKFQIVIGRNVAIDIPGVVMGIPAKIDTGAYRSVIHCKEIKLVDKDNKQVLKAKILGHQCSPVVYDMVFDEFDRVTIVNSFGVKEERYEVKIKVKITTKVFNASFTLADRSNNFFPVLIGRKILMNRFIVDVSKAAMERAKLRKQFGITGLAGEEDEEG